MLDHTVDVGSASHSRRMDLRVDKLEDGAGVLERDLGNLAKRNGVERRTWNVDFTESTYGKHSQNQM